MAISRPRRSLVTSITVGERKPKDIVETSTLIRSMYQTSGGTYSQTALVFEFPFGISAFTHDGAGVLYTEIPRPLNLPLVDATSQKLERCSFEFLIAFPYDSLQSSIDRSMTILQDFANEARSVNFLNVHSALALKTWNIDSISFQVTRTNQVGQATAVTCNMSLVENIARTNERFYGLPKFTYTIPKGTGLAGTTGNGSGTLSVTGSVIKIQGFIGGEVKITTAASHGLKNGSKVTIEMTHGNLTQNILGLHAVGLVYEISAVTATTFKYRHTTAGLVAETDIVAPQVITYTTTDAVTTSPFLLQPAAVVNNATGTNNTASTYVFPKTTGPFDHTTTLAAEPLYPNVGLDTRITNILIVMKFENPDIYGKQIGNTSTESYKKAKMYLTSVNNLGKNIYKVSINELVQNIG